ncbi:MAG: NUDIX hydrolase [Arenibacterium sp.]
MTKTKTTSRASGEADKNKQVQVAALCYRETGKDEKDVLLITSRETKRWIIPKGWPIDGLKNSEAALQEAWEEAGVKKALVAKKPLGHFDYPKRLANGKTAEIETEVFLARVERMSESYPEDDERTRKWVSPCEAANLVQEPGLKSLLLAL